MYRVINHDSAPRVVVVSSSWMDAERDAQPAIAAQPGHKFSLEKQDAHGNWQHVRRVEPRRSAAPVFQN